MSGTHVQLMLIIHGPFWQFIFPIHCCSCHMLVWFHSLSNRGHSRIEYEWANDMYVHDTSWGVILFIFHDFIYD